MVDVKRHQTHMAKEVADELPHQSRMEDGRDDDESCHHTFVEHASAPKGFASAGSSADAESSHQTRMVDRTGDEPASTGHTPTIHSCELEQLSKQWRLLASRCITVTPADAIHCVPAQELLEGYMPMMEAALRRQAIQMLANEYAQTTRGSQLASIVMRSLLILQLVSTDVLPDDMLVELTAEIIILGNENPSDRSSLFKCRNLLAHALPLHALLASDRFTVLQPEGKRRRRKKTKCSDRCESCERPERTRESWIKRGR